jgi:hypothetical protein
VTRNGRSGGGDIGRLRPGVFLLALATLAASAAAAIGGPLLGSSRALLARPVNLTPPTISGIAQVGRKLKVSHGTWLHSPTSFSYKWARCSSAGSECRAIVGATHAGYLLGKADVGKRLRVSVIAYNLGGASRPARSAPSAIVMRALPVNVSPPTVSGPAQVGKTLTATHGEWTESPTSYGYRWRRCDASGANCTALADTTKSYTLAEADVGKTLRVAVTASNEAGSSQPALSAVSAVVTGTSTAVSHLEYVFQDGIVSVYDMDHEFRLLKAIVMPQTAASEVRGVTVAPSTHTMYIMHGGDGPINGSGNGSVLAYDLVGEKVSWDVALNTGVDSGQVSADGKKLYVPTGENTSSGIWNILSAEKGGLLGTIQGGSGAHNTVVSSNGRYVYLGGRNYNYLDVYETEARKVKQVGPLIGSVRPFTVNGSNTLAFTTATAFDGFQVSSITTGKVLFTKSFGEVPSGFPFSAPSHGIALSPDEKTLYVVDAVHKAVQFYDVSRLKEDIAPRQIAALAVSGLSGTESPCIYDCTRGGWLQLSLDGRYLFVGDSGEVIETSTRKVLGTLPTLAQTKKSIEVDWKEGVSIATSGRTGVGQVP